MIHAITSWSEAMIRTINMLSAALLFAAPAWGQDKQSAQQERMKSCNAQAAKKDLKGDERKAFMSRCLSGDTAKKKDDEKELTAQQKRMKTCNAQASKKELKGDERQAFMTKCLSASAGSGSSGLSSQQQKMKTCNAQADRRDLKGEKRRDFMSDCLRG
jgi:hypothetical protein